MFTVILILILFLPAAFLPLALDTFVTGTDLDEMGISLESSDDTFPVHGCQLTGLLPASDNCEVWDISEPLHACQ